MRDKDSNQRISIPFSLPSLHHTEIDYILEAIHSHHRHGAGNFTARAIAKLKSISEAHEILLTHSCTGALELAMLLLDVDEGDEVIMPSFTFSSTANAVVLRKAIPIFADIDPRTQCIDPHSVIQLITPRTRIILPVHYAGIACNMALLCEIAETYSLEIIEDAAQAIGSSTYKKKLGTFGKLGALSFHDSKNISCGEGGAILINDKKLINRAEILWEKGTNRRNFMRGVTDKYTWVDLGSSFLPSELTAAFLLGQLERIEQINNTRRHIWNKYYSSFAEMEALGKCYRPYVPNGCEHNGHIFYLILNSPETRHDLLAYLEKYGVSAAFHYVPLHDSPAGKKFGRTPFPLPNTIRAGSCLVRLPIFIDMTSEQQDKVINIVNEFLFSFSQNELEHKLYKSNK
jgi:dTDP-4-amino-4,6-dideoxygalactose transaminase